MRVDGRIRSHLLGVKNCISRKRFISLHICILRLLIGGQVLVLEPGCSMKFRACEGTLTDVYLERMCRKLFCVYLNLNSGVYKLRVFFTELPLMLTS